MARAAAAPNPDDWKLQTFDTMVRSDREVLAALRRAQLDIGRQLRAIEFSSNLSANVRRAQLTLAKRNIQARMSTLWRQVGDITKARRLEAANRLIDVQKQMDVFLLGRAGLADAEAIGEHFAESMKATAESGLDRFEARVTGGSYTPLSDRVYNSGVGLNSQVDRLVNSALAQALSAKEFATLVRDFVNPATPGGVRYASLRLSRTEINNAAHAVAIEQVQDHPWVESMQWHLSGSHPRIDICNSLASGGLKGDGVYPKGAVPAKPHPQCFCFVVPVLPTDEEFLDNLLAGHYDSYVDKYRAPGRATIPQASQPARAPVVQKAVKPRKSAAAPASKVPARVSKGPLIKSTRVAGKDQAVWMRARHNIDELNTAIKEGKEGDQALKLLAKKQKFDGLPQVVSSTEMDSAIEAGWTEGWRGVDPGLSETTKTSHEINQQLRRGEFFPGLGIYGNGTYLSAGRGVGEVYAGAGEAGMGQLDSLVRAAIDPRAKTIDYDKLLVEQREFLAGLDNNQDLHAKLLRNLMSDEGRFATMRGYDVVKIVGREDGSDFFDAHDKHFDQYIILNRTVLMIERWRP